MAFSWIDYDDGIARFVDGVLPLMEQAGLRSAPSRETRAA
jgi:hypothetical protein